ncbi:MAG: DUF72 domain-containing protein [Armatimonadetes bacterium]|nr:DUF72 domain-containing protein [Armatimonadota bacterium]
MPRLYCGTSGWNYKDWRSRFYPVELPPSGWLRYYSGQFDTVEINYSFYRLPEREAFERWRDEVPPGFTFAVKASRYLTHMKKLKDAEEPLGNVLSHSDGLGDKRGPILYQLPPYWHMDLVRLESFLKILPRDVRHAFEFRDDSWQNDSVWSLLEQYHVAYCIMDAPGLPLHLRTTADFTYIRLHHGGEATQGDYSDDHLAEWARRIEPMLERGDLYVYFNNDQYGFAVRNAMRLRGMVSLPSKTP